MPRVLSVQHVPSLQHVPAPRVVPLKTAVGCSSGRSNHAADSGPMAGAELAAVAASGLQVVLATTLKKVQREAADGRA